jgi:signal transduction histidine kinase
MAKEKRVGMLVLNTRTARVLTSEELTLLGAIGQQVGIAVENARLYKGAQQVAATAERSRLARELHDSVTQSLYSVMLFAEASARSLANQEIAEASDYMKELRDTAQEALREMRLLIFELRPPALEKHGLVAALHTRLNAVEGRGGMKSALHVSDDRRAEQLPPVMQEELYQIVREALNNVIRHAHAQRVEVGIAFAERTIQLEVTDDGIGFAPVSADESSGLGLRGMRERVQRIGGTLEISSENGKGTRVTVQVPYSGDDGAAAPGSPAKAGGSR